MNRYKRLLSRTPLQPGKPLQRKTPLAQVGRKGITKGRKPQANTGPDRTTRELVLERDNYSCVRCGKPILGQPYSLQHRVARVHFGKSDPAKNRPSNLIVLCGSATSPDGCHLRAEQRGREEHDEGYWLNSWENPAEVWVHHFQYGVVLLLDDGTVEVAPQTGDAA